MPPAPTMPSTADSRSARSEVNRLLPMKLGTNCGHTPLTNTCTRLAPVASSATQGCGVDLARASP